MSETRPDRSPFTAVLLERDGKYFFYQPGLAVIASGESVEGAYQKFIGARRDLIQEVESAGLSTGRASAIASPPPSRTTPARSDGVLRELGLFLAKTCIVLLIIGGIGLVAALGVRRAVERSVARLISSTAPFVQALGGGQSTLLDAANPLKKISLVDALNRAAQHAQAMPEDRKEQLRQSIGILSREADPLIEAWRNPPPSPEPKTNPESPTTNNPGR